MPEAIIATKATGVTSIIDQSAVDLSTDKLLHNVNPAGTITTETRDGVLCYVETVAGGATVLSKVVS